MKKDRILYIDAIKIFSIILVIILHCSGEVIRFLPLNSGDFIIANFFDTISRAAVPLFLMASGAYFLNNKNNITIKSIFKNNIFKIALVLIMSSSIIEITKYLIDPSLLSTKTFIRHIALGDPILWFFYTLIGLYIVTPLLRCITKTKENTQYFLLLFFIISILIPSINYIWPLSIIEPIISQLSIKLVMGTVGYYVLGYYLDSFLIKKKATNCLYFLGIIGLIATFFLTQYISMKSGKIDIFYYKNMSITVFFTAIATFLIFKNIFKDKKYNNKKLKQVATSTLYIYPIHRWLLIILPNFNIINTKSNPIINIPTNIVILSISSLLIALIVMFIIDKFKNQKKLAFIVYFTLLLLILLSFRIVQQEQKHQAYKPLTNSNEIII